VVLDLFRELRACCSVVNLRPPRSDIGSSNGVDHGISGEARHGL
jgi:hypothetical protein